MRLQSCEWISPWAKSSKFRHRGWLSCFAVTFGRCSVFSFDEFRRYCESQALSKTSQSGSNKDWERFMIMHSGNDILKILESATSSDHGNGSIFDRSASKSVLLLRYLEMWLRFDSTPYVWVTLLTRWEWCYAFVTLALQQLWWLSLLQLWIPCWVSAQS